LKIRQLKMNRKSNEVVKRLQGYVESNKSHIHTFQDKRVQESETSILARSSRFLEHLEENELHPKPSLAENDGLLEMSKMSISLAHLPPLGVRNASKSKSKSSIRPSTFARNQSHTSFFSNMGTMTRNSESNFEQTKDLVDLSQMEHELKLRKSSEYFLKKRILYPDIWKDETDDGDKFEDLDEYYPCFE